MEFSSVCAPNIHSLNDPQLRYIRAGLDVKNSVPVVGPMAKGRQHRGLRGHAPFFRHPRRNEQHASRSYSPSKERCNLYPLIVYL